MAPPLYFFPGVAKTQLVQDGKLSAEVLGPRNLTRTFADIEDAAAECFVEDLQGTGPGGSAGVILRAFATNGDRPTRTGYYPKDGVQEWTHFTEAGGDFWVGVDTVLRPEPVDLLRKSHFPGYTLKLAGGEWVVPVIRDPEGGTGLPRKWIQEANGDVTEQVKEAYKDLWESFAGVVDVFFNPDDPSPAWGCWQIDRQEAMTHCLQALTIDYRIGRVEQNLLGLVNAENWVAILGAVVDLNTFFDVYTAAQESKKKRDDAREPKEESPDTEPGEPDDSPDTDQVEPN